MRYAIRYTSYPNRRNTPNPAATQNKPPILPKLSTNYDSIMQNKANFPDAQMNVSHVITMEYENETLSGSGKNKANTKPNKPNLLNTQMNVSSFSTKEYENIYNWTLVENKPKTNPKQTQTKPISKPKLKPSKSELIKRIWGYKSTIALTFARNSLILLGTSYLMPAESGIENSRFETACFEKRR